MSSISLNDKGGVEPHMTACEACGEEYGLTVGVLRRAQYRMPDGTERWAFADRSRVHKTKRVMDKIGAVRLTDWEHVPEDERVIKLGLCGECDKPADVMDEPEIAEAINEGGVLWRCLECRQGGAIKYSESTKEFCDAAREQNGVEFGQPCGVEFDKCEQHGAES